MLSCKVHFYLAWDLSHPASTPHSPMQTLPFSHLSLQPTHLWRRDVKTCEVFWIILKTFQSCHSKGSQGGKPSIMSHSRSRYFSQACVDYAEHNHCKPKALCWNNSKSHAQIVTWLQSTNWTQPLTLLTSTKVAKWGVYMRDTMVIWA